MKKKIIFPKGKHAFVIQGTEKEKEQACIEIRDWAVKNNITMPAILTYESILNFRHCNYILWNGMCLDACLRNFSVVGYTIHYTVESFMKVFEVEESEQKNQDHWFDANLRCILGTEVELVKKGLKEKIDRKMLSDWILKNL